MPLTAYPYTRTSLVTRCLACVTDAERALAELPPLFQLLGTADSQEDMHGVDLQLAHAQASLVELESSLNALMTSSNCQETACGDPTTCGPALESVIASGDTNPCSNAPENREPLSTISPRATAVPSEASERSITIGRSLPDGSPTSWTSKTAMPSYSPSANFVLDVPKNGRQVSGESTERTTLPRNYRRNRFGPIGFLLPLCVLSSSWAVASVVYEINFASAPHQRQDRPILFCPRETVCAGSWRSVIFLLLSRGSAYFDYPLHMALFLSKAQNLHALLDKTLLREILPLGEMHELHTLAGKVVGIEVLSHSLWHIIRWGLDGDIMLLTSHSTGITGLISLSCMPFVVGPMVLHCLKRRLSFELRKALHYLSILWGVSICFHAPKAYIAYLIGIPLVIYFADCLFGFFMSVHHVRTLEMTRLGASDVEISWENPRGFNHNGSGKVYVCLPWISLWEWHAFSIMSHATSPGSSTVCMAVVGDWTVEVFKALRKPSVRHAWLYGPFPSVFSKVTAYDNIIAIASGIGITPAISAVVNFRGSRKVSVIWAVRDPDLLEHYVKILEFDDDAWTFIFYTGSRLLALEPNLLRRNRRVRIFSGRPALEDICLAIMDNVESSIDLPEDIWNNTVQMHKSISTCSSPMLITKALERVSETYSESDLFRWACEARAEGETDSDLQLNKVSLSGFKQFVKLISCIDDDRAEQTVERLFHTADANGDGFLDESEFLNLFGEVGCSRPSQVPRASLSSLCSQTRSRALQRRLATWVNLYCGHNKSIIESLRRFSKMQDVALEIENNDW